MERSQKLTRRDLWCILGLLLAVIPFLLVFASATSPLTHWLGWDSSIFTLLGRSLLEGKTPYADIFDIKGPMIYFIEALGQLMAPWRAGSFLLEIPFDMLSVLFLYLTARLFLSRGKSVAAVGLSFCFLAATFMCGNLTEEYCLPADALCLYLALRLFSGRWDGKADNPPAYAFLYGVCCAYTIWIKITHGALIFGIVLYFSCSLLWQKKFKLLFQNAAAFLAGIALVTVPIIVWFVGHDALQDMLFGTFIAPLRYADLTAEHRTLSDYLNLGKDLAPVLAVAFFVILFRLYRHQLGRLLLCCCGVSAAALMPGASFSHYFMVLTPYIPVGTALMLGCRRGEGESSPGTKRLANILFAAYSVVLFIAGAYLGGVYSAKYLLPSIDQTAIDELDAYTQQGAMIPEQERDSVLLYAGSTASRWYEANRIIPCYKYCVSYFITQTPEAIEDFSTLMKTDPPLWLATYSGFPVPGEGFIGILYDALTEKYDLVISGANISLFRLRDGA